jgi:hypothetical protein
MACLVLSLIAIPEAWASEWDNMRERYDNKLRAHAKRIAEIEAREREVSADEEKRTTKITRDRIAGINASLKSGSKARTLGDTAERAAGSASALADVYREQDEYLGIATSEWGADGSERRKLRESMASAQKNIERASAELANAVEAAETTITRVSRSGVLEQVARMEAEAKEVGDRLRARWQQEQAARERERQQRERAAAERERGVR